MKINRKTNDLVVTGLIAAGAALLYWNTFSFSPSLLPGYPGDAFFPRIIIIFILICSAAVFVQALLSGSRGAAASAVVITVDVPGVVTTTGFVLGYVLLLGFAGFEITTFLFIIGLLGMRYAGRGRRGWAILVASSMVTVGICYVVFVLLLGVDMPLLFLPKYLDF